MIKGQRFKVMYRRPGRSELIVYDMIMPSRTALMKHLDEREGISASTTDELVVHHFREDGAVIEFYSWNKAGGRGKPVIKLAGEQSVADPPAPDKATRRTGAGRYLVTEA